MKSEEEFWVLNELDNYLVLLVVPSIASNSLSCSSLSSFFFFSDNCFLCIASSDCELITISLTHTVST